MKGFPKREMLLICGTCILLFTSAAGQSFAVQNPTVVASATSTAPGPTNQQEIEVFADHFFASQMPKWHIPGAAFVVIKNGQVLFAKGYGYTNLEKRIPVFPDRTVFRVGSVSKVFTATAVMQLVERGKLDLHADVNSYLKPFKLKNPYHQPVTLAEILTHTAGFDDGVIDLAVHSPAQVTPLAEFLARHMPPIVMPPGKIYSYSSYGIALAGYIAQQASGQSFNHYITKNILEPLDMRDSSLQLTPQLAARLATGYGFRRGRYFAEPIDYFNVAPAVSLYSTATDIAHFAIAHLQDGRYGDARILKASTAQEMHRRQFTEDPRLAGRAFGFYERFVNGRRVIGHGGNIRGFASLLILIPSEQVGFFMVCNRNESRFEDDLTKSFFDHYYPAPASRERTQSSRGPADDFRKYTGSYISNPYCRRTFEKLITLYWQFRIAAKPDGSLEFHYPHNFEPASHWVPRAPKFFERGNGEGYAVFQTDASGRVTHLFTDADSYEKVPWYEVAAFQTALVKFLMLILLSGVVFWPVKAGIGRWIKRPHGNSGRMLWPRWIAGAAGVLDVIFILVMLHVLSGMDMWDFVYGVPASIKALLWIPMVAAALTAAMVYFALRIWIKHDWSLWSRVHYSLMTVAAVVFVWFFTYWNLLGFRY